MVVEDYGLDIGRRQPLRRSCRPGPIGEADVPKPVVADHRDCGLRLRSRLNRALAGVPCAQLTSPIATVRPHSGNPAAATARRSFNSGGPQWLSACRRSTLLGLLAACAVSPQGSTEGGWSHQTGACWRAIIRPLARRAWRRANTKTNCPPVESTFSVKRVLPDRTACRIVR